MPKVIWVIDGRELYGERRAIVTLATGVRAAGWEVEVFSLTEGPCAGELAQAGLKLEVAQIHGTPGMHLARSRLGKFPQFFRLCAHQFKVAKRVGELLKRRDAAVIHTLNANTLPGVAWAARRCGVPCFWEMTRELTQRRPPVNKWVYRLLARLLNIHTIANSAFTASTLPPLHPPAAIMHLGADPKRFNGNGNPAVTRNALGIPSDVPVFTIVARLDPSKGQEVFVRAAMSHRESAIHIVLVGDSGDSGYMERFRGIVDSCGAQKRVLLVGHSPQPEAYIAISDVVVNARVDAESFGLSVIEAMLMGKPVLAHALGGPSETVVDSQTGWHVLSPTVQEFAKGIGRCMADRGRWREMGNAAKQRAMEHFSIEIQVARYLAIVTPHMANAPHSRDGRG